MRRLITDDENHVHTALVDIDGVIADITHRLDSCPGRPGVTNDSWEAYHKLGVFDPPIPGNVQLVRMLWRGGYDVVLVTNRPEAAREDGGHHGSKEWVIERLHLPTTALAVDDDLRHLEMYARYGIPGLYVHSGYYEGIDDEHLFTDVPDSGTREADLNKVVKYGSVLFDISRAVFPSVFEPAQSSTPIPDSRAWAAVDPHDHPPGTPCGSLCPAPRVT